MTDNDPPPPGLSHDAYQIWHYAGDAVRFGGNLGILALNIRAQLRLEGESTRLSDTIRWLVEAGRGCLSAMTNDHYARPRVGMEAEYEEMRLAIENAQEAISERVTETAKPKTLADAVAAARGGQPVTPPQRFA